MEDEQARDQLDGLGPPSNATTSSFVPVKTVVRRHRERLKPARRRCDKS